MAKFHDPNAESDQQLLQDMEAETRRIHKWDRRFLDLAALVSSWSKDPSTKVGAVIVRPDLSVASLGFNGFPRAVLDSPERLENRDLKYRLVLHAEVNAILNAHERLDGYTMYVWPPGYGPTCERCAVHVIQAGIKRVVGAYKTDGFASRWKESCEAGIALYHEAGVQVTMYV